MAMKPKQHQDTCSQFVRVDYRCNVNSRSQKETTTWLRSSPTTYRSTKSNMKSRSTSIRISRLRVSVCRTQIRLREPQLPARSRNSNHEIHLEREIERGNCSGRPDQETLVMKSMPRGQRKRGALPRRARGRWGQVWRRDRRCGRCGGGQSRW